jgi:hypothetical protein
MRKSGRFVQTGQPGKQEKSAKGHKAGIFTWQELRRAPPSSGGFVNLPEREDL